MDFIARLFNDATDGAQQLAHEAQQRKENAEIVRIVAIVSIVAFAALGVFALASGVLLIGGPAGIAFGIAGAAACTFLALAARDVYVISNQIANRNFLHTLGRSVMENNNTELYATAAQNAGTLLLRPDFIRWFGS